MNGCHTRRFQPSRPVLWWKKGTELETRNLLLSKKVYITKHIAEMRPMHACNIFCHVMSTSYKVHRKKLGCFLYILGVYIGLTVNLGNHCYRRIDLQYVCIFFESPQIYIRLLHMLDRITGLKVNVTKLKSFRISRRHMHRHTIEVELVLKTSTINMSTRSSHTKRALPCCIWCSAHNSPKCAITCQCEQINLKFGSTTPSPGVSSTSVTL